jgi:hypothetical protein
MRSFFWILFLGFLPLLSFSQFNGGNGSGNFRASSGFRLLNGNHNIPLFPGGSGRGDGFQNVGKLLRITLNGSPDPLPYPGGVGHGSKSFFVPYSGLSGQNPFIFSGGSGDGWSGNQTGSISLNGENRNPNLDFKGGNGNGNFIASSAQLFLTGISPNSNLSHFGGSGNGSSRARSSKDIFLTGSFYNHPFPGGSGRGDRTIKSSKLTLAGVLAPVMARIARSAILDFYHAPDYVPKRARLNIEFQPENQLKEIVLQHQLSGMDFKDHSRMAFQNGSPEKLEIPVELKPEGQLFRVLQIFLDSSQTFSDQILVEPFPSGAGCFAYPNPAGESLVVASTSNETIAKVELFDIRGKEIVCQLESLMNGKIRINVSALSPGLYSLMVTTVKGFESLRFSKK